MHNFCIINRLCDIGMWYYFDYGRKNKSTGICFAKQKLGEDYVDLTICENRCLRWIGKSSLMGHCIGVLSTSILTGFLRLASGLGSLHLGGGNLTRPSDCNNKSRLRHTMSLSAPFACCQFHALQTSCEMKRLLPSGWAAMISLITAISDSLTLRPRYVAMISIPDTI